MSKGVHNLTYTIKSQLIYYCFINRLIDTEQPRTRSIGFDWKSYQTLESIYEWLDEQLRAHPSILTGLEVGQSYENRTIRAVRLSHKAVDYSRFNTNMQLF